MSDFGFDAEFDDSADHINRGAEPPDVTHPMKVPLQLKCHQCQAPATERIHLDATSFDWKCKKCGYDSRIVFDLNVTIGYLILEQSRYEFEVEKDFSMAIVLAAMALECEAARLFGKWKQIDTEKAGGTFDKEQCEKELRELGNVNKKIEAVSNLLVGNGMDGFVSSRPHLSQEISKGFTSIRVGSLVKDFQEKLFWPRNAILHWGDAKHSQNDAARCYSIAQLGLSILRRMDEERKQSSNSRVAG